MRVPHTKDLSLHPRDRVNDPLFDPLYHATRIVLGFVQGLFKSLPSSQYQWSPDPESTEIIITDAAPITYEALTQRPHIISMRGQASYANTALQSFAEQHYKTGARRFRDAVMSSITLNCISRNGVEASRLAWFTASHIKALRHLLQRSGPFVGIGQDVTVGGEMPPGMLLQDAGDGGAVNVPVMLPFTFMHQWEVLEPALIIDNLNVNIDGDASHTIIVSEEDNG